jgi:hypothetical protein
LCCRILLSTAAVVDKQWANLHADIPQRTVQR